MNGDKDNLKHLVEEYYIRNLSEEEMLTLNEGLKESAEMRKYFSELSLHECLVQETALEQSSASIAEP